MPTDKEIKELIEVAVASEENAFVFKSGHKFGAAVLTTDGEIFGGCNIDGVISSLGKCAEVVALDQAVVHGKYNMKAILTVDEEEFVFPCGTCLQYLGQFYQTNGVDIEVVAAKKNGEWQSKKLTELLPTIYLSLPFDEKLKSFKNK